MIDAEKGTNNPDNKQEVPYFGFDGIEQISLSKKVAESAWKIAREKTKLLISLEKVDKFESAFLSIEDATGIASIDCLVDTLLEAEMQNYELYNNMNVLNDEIENVEQQINRAKLDIEKFNDQSLEKDNQKHKKVKMTEIKLEKINITIKEYEDKLGKNQKVLDSIKDAVLLLFNKFEEFNESDPDLHGITFNDETILKYLGYIERKANDIVYQTTQNIQEIKLHPYLLGNRPPDIAPGMFELKPPSISEQSVQEDENYLLPLSIEQIRNLSSKKFEILDRERSQQF